MIRTARLVLRPAQPDDLDDLHAIFSNPRAMRYWDRPEHTDIAETQAFLNAFMTNDHDASEEYILEFRGRCVGKAGMWKKPEVGYILHPELWGQGLTLEAMQAVVPRIFARFADLPALTAECDPRNIASIKLLEKLGFRQTGFAEKNFDYGGLEMCDTTYFELDRADQDES
ncbi:MAG: GNAT family N-acetyltransferase [Pseudomonadota bacterium]